MRKHAPDGVEAIATRFEHFYFSRKIKKMGNFQKSIKILSFPMDFHRNADPVWNSWKLLELSSIACEGRESCRTRPNIIPDTQRAQGNPGGVQETGGSGL